LNGIQLSGSIAFILPATREHLEHPSDAPHRSRNAARHRLERL